jgi:Methyltransferase domain
MLINAASTIVKLQKNIDRIIKFLERDFINCHMVTYLSDNLWTKFIPETIRSEITCNDDVNTAIEVFFEQENAPPELIRKHQQLYDHIQKTKTYYLENLPDDKLFITTDELLDEFEKRNIPHSTGLNLSIREFMKEKKNHEVEIISRLVAALSKARGKEHFIIDVGDGKGYLSSRLSLEFKLKVLGIDGNQSNTKEAEKRNLRLSKTWNALVKKEAKKKNIDLEIDGGTRKNDLYKTTSKMIFADTNLKQLAEEKFPDEDHEDICLVGLHTCGNLAPNSLKQFVRNDEIKLVCSVGCCYHLLHEEFEKDIFNDEVRMMDERDESGFPLSNFLREKKYKLGRNGRMLAAQCFERVIESKNLPDESLFYRALFEKILREKWSIDGTPTKVLKLGKIKFKSFEEYFRKGCKKFDIDIDISSEEIEELMKQYDHERHLIKINYFIRLLNAKVIETLILLDRYLYLLENNVDDVFLVKIFDPVISPRNYGFIAIKK